MLVRRSRSYAVIPLLLWPLLLGPLTLWIGAALLDGSAAQAQTAADASGYRVRGAVVNRVTGQSIARALVVLNQDYATLTGADGQFSFDHVPAGDYSVSVQRPGFNGIGGGPGMRGGMTGRGSFFVRGTAPRRIQVGPDLQPLSLALTPLGTISGTVTLSTADSPDGIFVSVYRHALQNGFRRWVMAGRVRTRSDGTFRVPDVPAGSYLIYTQAMPDRGALAESPDAPVWGFPAVYYPGVTDASAAGIITLGPGQQAEADFTLTRQRFFPVTAIVESGAETPGSFRILDGSGRSSGLFARYDASTRTVRAVVPNGSWAIEAHTFARGGGGAGWGRVDFQVAGAPVRLAISIVPVPKVPVDIQREFTASADPAQGGIQASAGNGVSGPGLYLTLQPAGEFSEGASGAMRPVQGAGQDGPWEIDISEPGRYWIQGNAFPPAYISSITSGGTDLMSSPLVVAPGGAPAPVQITLRNDGGTIAGQVNGISAVTSGTGGGPPGTGAGQAQPQVWVYAIPLFPTVAQVPTGFVLPTGTFQMPNLAPGSYRVVACDTQQEIDIHSPQGLAAWAGKGQTVTVDAGGTASVQLDVVHLEGEP